MRNKKNKCRVKYCMECAPNITITLPIKAELTDQDTNVDVSIDVVTDHTLIEGEK